MENKTNGTTAGSGKEMPRWDDIKTEQKPAVELFDGNEHTLVFKSNRPFETESKKFKGKPVMIFDVVEGSVEKNLIVTAVRLAVPLKKMEPLSGKVISIKRSGKGTDTSFAVRDLSSITTEEVGVEA